MTTYWPHELYRAFTVFVLTLGALNHIGIRDADAKTYYVRTLGNDRNDGTSPSTAWQTLSKALTSTLQQGDTVHVGAGSYIERVSASGVGLGVTGRTQTVRLVADISGRFTGDRGPVRIVPSAGYWAIHLNNSGPLQFEGFTFGPATGVAVGYGVYTYGNSDINTVSFRGCTFENLIMATRFHQASGSVIDSTFTSNAYGVYASRADSLSIEKSTFTSSTGWGVATTSDTVTLAECDFTGANGAALSLTGTTPPELSNCSFSDCSNGLRITSSTVSVDREDNLQFENCDIGVYLLNCESTVTGLTATTCRLPLYLSSGNAIVKGIELNSSKFGLYAVNMTSLAVTNSTFQTTASWGCVATGQDLSIKNTSFTGIYGLYLVETSHNQSPDLDDLTFEDCTYGLQVLNSVVRFNTSQRLKFSNCHIGIYLASCDSTLSNLTLSGGYLPVYLTGGTARVDRVTTTDGSHGVYAVNMDSFTLTNGVFTTSSTWGTVATGTKLSISDCLFQGANGLYIRDTGGSEAPVLKRLTFKDCSYGLQCDNSTVVITKDSQLTFKDCRTGLYLNNCSADVSGLSITAGYLPVYVVRGSALIDDVTVQNGTYGLYATSVTRLAVTNLTANGHSSWGVYATGIDLTLSDSAIEKGGHGVYFKENSAEREVDFHTTTVAGHTGYGVYLDSTSLQPMNDRALRILDNKSIGLGLINSDLEISGDSGIELTRNGYGVYTVRGNVRLSGLTLNDNNYGVYHSQGELRVTDCTLNGGSFGIRQLEGSSLALNNVSISKPANWGLHVATTLDQTTPLTITGLDVTDGGNGVYIAVPTGSTMTITRSQVLRNRGYGVLTYRADTTVTDTVASGNGNVGLYHLDGPLTVEDCTANNNRSYGILNTGSALPASTQLKAHGCTVSENSAGIGCWNGQSAVITGNIVSKNSYGIVTRFIGTGGETWHNTLSDNVTSVWHAGGEATLKNNILSSGDLNSTVKSGTGIYVSEGTLNHGHNLLFGQSRAFVGTSRGPGELIKPPRFADYSSGDFRLSKGSPAINAGTSTGLTLKTDRAGIALSLFGAPEAGAFEFAEKNGSLRIIDWKELAAPPRTNSVAGPSAIVTSVP